MSRVLTRLRTAPSNVTLHRHTRRPVLSFLLAAVAAAVALGLPSPAQAAGSASGTYELRNSASGLRADVMWASTASMTGAFLWPDNSSLSQEFNLVDGGNGFFRIQARHSGQCLMLDWRGGSTSTATGSCSAPTAPRTTAR